MKTITLGFLSTGLLGTLTGIVTLTGSVLSAAELRTTSGNKPVVRQASFQQADEMNEVMEAEPDEPQRDRSVLRVPDRPAPQPAAPGRSPGGRQPLVDSDSELVVEESEPELWPADGFSGSPGCSHGGCGIGSSGLSGCGLGNCGWNCGSGLFRSGCCWLHGWASAEYLFARRSDMFLPPLVTGGPNGVLPAAPVLFGNGDVGGDVESAGRFSVGLWFDECEQLGMGVRFLILDEENVRFDAASTGAAGTQVLARPFIDVNNANANDALLIAAVNVASNGEIHAGTSSDVLSGDLLVRKRLWTDCCSRSFIDFLCGYQYSRISEELFVEHSFVAAANNPNVAAGTAVSSRDDFQTENNYHAGMFGLQGEFAVGCFRVNALAKVGLGGMHQAVDIRGSTTIGGVTQTGGLLAQDTNIGRFAHTEFAYSQEVGLGLTYQIAPWFDLTAGYTFLYWSDVSQPGNQIDRGIDDRFLSQVRPVPPPAPTRPSLLLLDSDYWVHGLNLGASVRF